MPHKDQQEEIEMLFEQKSSKRKPINFLQPDSDTKIVGLDTKPSSNKISVAVAQLSLCAKTTYEDAGTAQSHVGSWSSSGSLSSCNSGASLPSSKRLLIIQLDSVKGALLTDSASFPSFLPKSIPPAQLIKATVVETKSSGYRLHENAGKEVKAYELKITYSLHDHHKHQACKKEDLGSRSAAVPAEDDIIVISSDEDEKPSTKTAKSRRSVNDEDDDMKVDTDHIKLEPLPSNTSHQPETVYELSCSLALNGIRHNQGTPSIFHSQAEPTPGLISFIKEFQGFQQLLAHLKKSEPIVGVQHLHLDDSQNKSEAIPGDHQDDVMDMDNKNQKQQISAPPSHEDRAVVGDYNLAHSPASDCAPLASPRRISSIAESEASRNDSRDASEFGQQDMSLDIMNFDSASYGLDVAPKDTSSNIITNTAASSHGPSGPFGAITIPAAALPPPAMTKTDATLSDMSTLGLEKMDIERELDEGKARHDFLHNHDMFRAPSSPPPGFPIDKPISDALDRTQVDVEPSNRVLQVEPTSFTPSPSPSPRMDTNLEPSSSSIAAPDLDQMDQTDILVPASLLADPMVPDDAAADIPIPARLMAGRTVPTDTSDDIPVLLGDTTVPDQTPAHRTASDRSPSEDLACSSVPACDSVPAPGGSQAEVPVPGSVLTGGPAVGGTSANISTAAGKRPFKKSKTERESKTDQPGPSQTMVWEDLEEVESDPEDGTYEPGTTKHAAQELDDDDESSSGDSGSSEGNSNGGSQVSVDTLPPLPEFPNVVQNAAGGGDQRLSYEELSRQNAVQQAYALQFSSKSQRIMRQWKFKVECRKRDLIKVSNKFRRLKSKLQGMDDNILELKQDCRLECQSIQQRVEATMETGVRDEIALVSDQLRETQRNIDILLLEREIHGEIRADLEEHIYELEATLRTLQFKNPC
ncbi:hypothetical protein PCASD_10520 [Puccinia coronata f. sp. avenae]|uniref:Uncharacterized protein n=1 Tax=Puccinia coronata f. sp. avenae TaxID=200324 RepID=A0A2N5TC48_9BASI|nr:hypothetical protein PCASD_10520 [Puccinia coronata f. sp. avenae]